MAEFRDVMSEFSRLCDEHRACTSSCAMLVAAHQHGVPCRDFILKFPELAEREILAWSEANPLKRFPTYNEYLEKVFPASRLSAVACYRAVLFGENTSSFGCSGNCNVCMNEVMNEETATKMGIEPAVVRR